MADRIGFNTDDRVVIRAINRLLNDQTGTVVGWSFEEVINMYIVVLDVPVVGEGGFVHKAVNLPESCLEKV